MQDCFERNITYLRLSVTDLCDLRCRYCMPEEGVCKLRHADLLSEDEMIRAVEAAASLGITKLRITGGEPLIKKNILSICRRASATAGIREVCVTTNGTGLRDLAKPLAEAGVRRINLSLDTLDPDKYAYITRRGSLSNALAGLDAALSAGFHRIKINTVLIGGWNDSEIPALAALTTRYPVDVRFIELMPMPAGADFERQAYLPCSAVLERLPTAAPQPDDGGVAQLYRLPGALGNIGLIRPVSQHFCASCNRLRLTADGKLKPCLHSSLEFPIKGLSALEMVAQFQKAILAKPARHGALSRENPSEAGRSMNQIGG